MTLRCQGTNGRGEQCARAAKSGSDYCLAHDPARAEERKRWQIAAQEGFKRAMHQRYPGLAPEADALSKGGKG